MEVRVLTKAGIKCGGKCFIPWLGRGPGMRVLWAAVNWLFVLILESVRPKKKKRMMGIQKPEGLLVTISVSGYWENAAGLIITPGFSISFRFLFSKQVLPC